MNANRAVLWDMDGTLIDSEDLHWISWKNTLANEGIFITHRQFLSSFGQRNVEIGGKLAVHALEEQILRGHLNRQVEREPGDFSAVWKLPGK